ncbi:hypothetical protein K440DRAFT_664683 [Wilcoxina mikolae CBS 423.85]|nr:hypothetical protein K440DRAFT_664683 [Wilcoxina mikolae CBS 423.85]
MNLLHLAAFLLPSLITAYDTTACNTSPSLCSTPYNSILHLGAHDSAFVRTAANKFTTAGNQYFNASTQLSAGVRLLQSQLHLNNNIPYLCHTTCSIFDGGPLKDWLGEINTWLSTRPSEVVTILLVNDDKIPPSQIAEAYKSAGLDTLSFTPANASWKENTLSTFIDAKKRVITYLSAGADVTQVPYLLPEFDHVFETAFENTDASNFTCYATRPSEVAGKAALQTAVETRMGLMNRFLYNEIAGTLKIFVTNDTYATTLNGDTGVGNLKDGVGQCFKEWGRSGGYVLLDFVDEGDPVKVVDGFNNVTKPVNREDFPSNPKTVQSQQNAQLQGGWAEVQRLAAEARNGTEVKIGQWIWAAGEWKGSWNRL